MSWQSNTCINDIDNTHYEKYPEAGEQTVDGVVQAQLCIHSNGLGINMVMT